jgi:hypothetical protein
MHLFTALVKGCVHFPSLLTVARSWHGLGSLKQNSGNLLFICIILEKVCISSLEKNKFSKKA